MSNNSKTFSCSTKESIVTSKGKWHPLHSLQNILEKHFSDNFVAGIAGILIAIPVYSRFWFCSGRRFRITPQLKKTHNFKTQHVEKLELSQIQLNSRSKSSLRQLPSYLSTLKNQIPEMTGLSSIQVNPSVYIPSFSNRGLYFTGETGLSSPRVRI